MVRFSESLMLIGMLATGLAVAAPEFDEAAELRRSNCDNDCFFESFPGGSCTDNPACHCTEKKYREAYYCCIAKNCEPIVLTRSIERHHDGCIARNLDFTFDVEEACGIELETTSSAVSAKTTATSSASEISPTATETTGTENTKAADKSAEGTAEASATGSSVPVTDGVAALQPAIDGLALFMAIALLFL
ncbi:hypothetical protein NW768_008273 [Fusarium equiseti]|uniref:Extracellular membrane protein CFEM domain-containing protein n=1 Tax=Fusarium equiseti TaxID=61235 RepID=A0ABQ8R6A7_FUSEQ|nr:hypothetical protein NW768_008273 [Fusarium equiseti]